MNPNLNNILDQLALFDNSPGRETETDVEDMETETDAETDTDSETENGPAGRPLTSHTVASNIDMPDCKSVLQTVPQNVSAVESEELVSVQDTIANALEELNAIEFDDDQNVEDILG
ncbi:hypothetical protein BGZ49_003403, partial [Haplosporangium sp. Z 27]